MRDAEYFSQQKQLKIKADDGNHQADYSLTIVPLSKGNVIPIRINKTVDASKFVYQLNNDLNANETYSIRYECDFRLSFLNHLYNNLP